MTLGRRMTSATLMLTVANAAVRLLSLVTMPILTRLLPPEAYGEASLAGSLIALLSVLALMGRDMSYARAFHGTNGPSGPDLEQFVWRSSLFASVLAGLFGGAGWLLVAQWFDLSAIYAGIVATGVVTAILMTMARMKAQLEGRYARLSWAGMITGLVTAALTLALARYWRDDGFPILIGMIVGQLATVAVLGVPGLTFLLAPNALSHSERRSVVGIGIAGVVTAPIYWLLSSSDRWFLGAMTDTATVGLYSIGYSIASLGSIVNTAIAAVWLPEAAKLFDQDEAGARIILGRLAEQVIIGLGIVWLAVSAAGGDILRLLAPQQYQAAAMVIPFIAGGVFFNGVTQLANSGAILSRQLHTSIKWMLISVLISVVLNLLLIRPYGALGAAVTQLVAFGTMAAGIWIQNWRQIPIPNAVRRLGLCGSCLLLAGLALFPMWFGNPLISLLAKAPVGLAITAAVGFWMAPEALGSLFARLGKVTRRA